MKTSKKTINNNVRLILIFGAREKYQFHGHLMANTKKILNISTRIKKTSSTHVLLIFYV